MLHSLVFSYRWEFQTEDYDIAFGVLRKSSGDKKKEDEEVVPMQRFNCQHVTEDGSVICDKPGTCKENILLDFAKLLTIINCVNC